MPKVFRHAPFAGFWLCASVGLLTIGPPLVLSSGCFGNRLMAQDFGDQDVPNQNPFGQMPDDDMAPRRGSRAKAARKKLNPAPKSTTKKSGSTAKTAGTAKKSGSDKDGLSFSQDIAPILVANCVGCHSGEGVGARRGKLDLSTFESLKKGSQKRKTDQAIVIAGKPEESHLVLRLNGEEEPRMPQGGNNRMSDAAIAKISQWVKEGAKLDDGLDPKKPLKSYAASPQQMARNQTARLPVQERDKKTELAGLERWKKANPELKPVLERGDHFILFSNLPAERAKATVKSMETQYGHLRRLLGSPVTDWPEKVGLYVFSTKKDFIEFVRTVEDRDAEADTQVSAKLAIAQPYLAVIDPAGGKKEESGSGRRRSRSKKGDSKDADASAGTDRSLAGLLTELLGTSVVTAAGAAPRWLSQGLGTYMAAQVEPRSPYIHQLRQTAFAEFGKGWRVKATEALGATDGITSEGLRAIGFALVEAVMSSSMRNNFPEFLQRILRGDMLDDTLIDVFGGNREEFLDSTGDWVATHYGRLE